MITETRLRVILKTISLRKIYGQQLSRASEYDEQRDTAYDRCWIADSVTGNGSGSYTFNAWQAEENVCHLFWDKDLWFLLNGCFEVNAEDLTKGPEYMDVSIRCALLAECLDAVLEEKQEQSNED